MHLTHHHNNMMTVLEASSSTTSWHHQPTMAASKSKQVKPSIPHVENKEEEQSLYGYKRGLFCDERHDMHHDVQHHLWVGCLGCGRKCARGIWGFYFWLTFGFGTRL
jgi:hypothetical protein